MNLKLTPKSAMLVDGSVLKNRLAMDAIKQTFNITNIQLLLQFKSVQEAMKVVQSEIGKKEGHLPELTLIGMQTLNDAKSLGPEFVNLIKSSGILAVCITTEWARPQIELAGHKVPVVYKEDLLKYLDGFSVSGGRRK